MGLCWWSLQVGTSYEGVEVVLRTGFKSSFHAEETDPPGLKPAWFAPLCGATQVMPLPKPTLETSSRVGCRLLLQFLVLCLRRFQDRQIRIRIFPHGKEILIGRPRLGSITCQCECASLTQFRQRYIRQRPKG